MRREILTCLRFAAASFLACALVYPAVLLGLGAVVAPEEAGGSLVLDDTGRVVGSRLIGQTFAHPAYLWPRPSAVDYDAAAPGGSNLAASNPALRRRVVDTLARLGASPEAPVPQDLVTASGSGLDPHISFAGARFQVPRIARARHLDPSRITAVLEPLSERGGPGGDRLVNVLEANLALDDAFGPPTGE